MDRPAVDHVTGPLTWAHYLYLLVAAVLTGTLGTLSELNPLKKAQKKLAARAYAHGLLHVHMLTGWHFKRVIPRMGDCLAID